MEEFIYGTWYDCTEDDHEDTRCLAQRQVVTKHLKWEALWCTGTGTASKKLPVAIPMVNAVKPSYPEGTG
jgi:hypothetical protein